MCCVFTPLRPAFKAQYAENMKGSAHGSGQRGFEDTG
jgi:hypothetical protein